ncbi:MAG TPA: CAP domain-containing protein [Trebonia sp.]|nr:CAP domain-containing protein [Trebonia sp.]
MAERPTPTRWARRLLPGVAVAVVLASAGLYLARGVLLPGPSPVRATASARATASGCGAPAAGSCSANPAYVAVAGQPAMVTVPARRSSAAPSASASSPSPRPAATGTTPAGVQPSAPATSGSSGGTSSASAAGQVLALINQARSAAGLPALTITSGLDASSSAHNLRMAGGCGLSHQCPGEQPLGNRETAAGVDWTSAGENIGEGGPVADSSSAIAQMAVGLTQSMLNEKPPDDGHRLNILSSTFTHIGIAVYRDSSGTVWLTQDFSN